MSLLDLSSFEKAVKTYRATCRAAQEDEILKTLAKPLQKAIQAGVIQNFEFTYELCWKFMKRWLEKNYGSSHIDGVTRRELFRLAAESQLIQDVEKWMFFHQARNQTSHIYDQTIAEEIYEQALLFVDIAEALLKQLQKRNDNDH